MTDKQALFFQELKIIQEQAVNMNIHQSDLTQEELLFNVSYDTLVLMFEKGETEGMIDHRLHGYDDTDRHILSAFISYWASKADQSQQKGDDARQKIFPPVARIIRKASSADFSISELFWLVTKMQFIEYVPLVKEYLQHIIDYPSKRYWEIHDTVKSLLEIEPQFIHDLLESKHRKLSDFGL